MQNTCNRTIPKIVYTNTNLNDYGSHDEEKYTSEKKIITKYRRTARPRVRRNSRRLSISIDQHSSSSSRSPSPSPVSHGHSSYEKPLMRVKYEDANGFFEGQEIEWKEQDVQSNEKTSSGYGQYLQLLKVPQSNFSLCLEWGEPSGDDLSSEWESDQSDQQHITIIKTDDKFPKVNPRLIDLMISQLRYSLVLKP